MAYPFKPLDKENIFALKVPVLHRCKLFAKFDHDVSRSLFLTVLLLESTRLKKVSALINKLNLTYLTDFSSVIFHSDRSRGTFGTRAGSLSSWWKGENSATVDIVNWRMALNIKEFWKLFLMLLLFLQLLFLLLLLLFLLLFTNRTGKRKSLGKSFLAVKQKISKECLRNKTTTGRCKDPQTKNFFRKVWWLSW